MEPKLYLVRWRGESFTFMFGAPNGMFDALDRIGSPSDAEVKIIPIELMENLYLDEIKKTGQFKFNDDVEDLLWNRLSKQVWPLEALGS